MINESKMKNTTKNAVTGVINQLVSLIFSFISRTVFIQCLGIEYLGVYGLFANILQVLSLADLGFGTAMIYSMYKPVVEKDERKLASLMQYYKKIYNMIAIAITIIGLSIIPLVPLIINTDMDISYLIFYYVLYLLNTVISYLFIYKTSITIAHQKSYLLNNYDSIFIILQTVLQIVFLVFTKNFIIYLIIQMLSTLIRNLYKAKKSEQLYPYINKQISIEKSEKKEIFKNVKSMFIYKFGGVVLNNTDNIIISILVGTISVGLYSNYLIIVTAINSMTNILFSSMTASIGQLNVSASNDEKFKFFRIINFLSIFIFSFCGICFYVLIDDFIKIWLGNSFTFDKYVVIAIVLNLVVPGFVRAISIFRDTIGMFNDTKYIFFTTSIINCVLSIILGSIFGLSGVLYATTISRLLTNVWYEPYVLLKKYLLENPKEYLKKQCYYWCVFLTVLVLVRLSSNLFLSNSLLTFLFKTGYCSIITVILLCIAYFRDEEFKYFVSLLKRRYKR